MALDVTTINQTNLWGKQADEAGGLEPQRSDLFLVDFKNAVKSVGAAANLPQLASIKPHYVRSIVFPEIRVKSDVVRRDSIPYNMPSWDDPLDAIKITFLLDTHDGDNKSDVVQFLNAWMALTRAGRGARFQGFNAQTGFLLLNVDYRVDFMFNINLYLLRGAANTSGGTVNNGQDTAAVAEFNARANAAYRNQRKRSGLVQQGIPMPDALDNSFESVLYAQDSAEDTLTQDMVIHTAYILHDAWLAAYKLTDLSHADSGLVSVEATFYADSIDLEKTDNISGYVIKNDQR